MKHLSVCVEGLIWWRTHHLPPACMVHAWSSVAGAALTAGLRASLWRGCNWWRHDDITYAVAIAIRHTAGGMFLATTNANMRTCAWP